MGSGIAHVFAASGYPVTMIDVSAESLERGLAVIEKNMARQVRKGALDPAARDLPAVAATPGLAR